MINEILCYAKIIHTPVQMEKGGERWRVILIPEDIFQVITQENEGERKD